MIRNIFKIFNKRNKFEISVPKGWVKDVSNRGLLTCWKENEKDGVIQISQYISESDKNISAKEALQLIIKERGEIGLKIKIYKRGDLNFAVTNYYTSKNGFFNKDMVVQGLRNVVYMTFTDNHKRDKLYLREVDEIFESFDFDK